MTRRRAALCAAVVALLLSAAYLLSRRGQSAVELADVPLAGPDLPVVPPSPRQTAGAVGPTQEPPATDAPTTEIVSAAPIVDAPTAPVLPTAPIAAVPVAGTGTAKEPPRSWGAGRAVPARTPAPVPDSVAESRGDVEEPLPTWVRAAIVVAALVAFFAVSLIATKQV